VPAELKRGVFWSPKFSLLAALSLSSCSFSGGHVGDVTTPFSQLEHLLGQGDDEVAARMQSKTMDGLTVTAALLPDEVARERYGVNLASKGIQAVWMRI